MEQYAQQQVKLIGGPLMGRSYPLAEGFSVGDIVQVPMTKKHAGDVTVVTKHHYRIDHNPAEGFFLSWINPADRRQHGR